LVHPLHWQVAARSRGGEGRGRTTAEVHMMRIWAVMERDLRRMLRNPFTLLSSVVLPLVYLIILGNSLQGPLHDLRLGIASQDDGVEARRLVGALQAVERGPRTITLVRVGGVEEGMQALHDGDLTGLLVIPPRFSSDLERGLVTPVGLFVDNVDA